MGIQVFAVMTSTASFTVYGVVPEVMSVTTETLTQELALEPGMKLSQKPIANLHFRYNNEAAAIVLSSSTESGSFENEFNKTFFNNPIKIGVKGECGSLDAKALAKGIELDSEGVDLKSERSSQLRKLNAGIEESCQLVASWNAETQKRSTKKGVYAMDLIVTMVAL